VKKRAVLNDGVWIEKEFYIIVDTKHKILIFRSIIRFVKSGTQSPSYIASWWDIQAFLIQIWLYLFGDVYMLFLKCRHLRNVAQEHLEYRKEKILEK
jgi:hypothetical protein